MKNSNVSNYKLNLIITSLFYIGLQDMGAQNLVMNPSFEDFIQCPKDFGTFHEDVLFWSKPSDGSTDYFNSCSAQMAIGRNFNGNQDAYHGNAYVGLYAYGPKDYREYIQGELKGKLKKSVKYEISVRISLSEKSEYAVDELGFLLTSKKLELHTKRNIPHSLMVKNGNSRYLGIIGRTYFRDKKRWMELKGEYTADGSERYITFGNFKGNRYTDKNSTGQNLKTVSYYYIDLISVKEIGKRYNHDEIYVFEGLNFDVDGFSINKKVEEQLKPLVDYLKENPEVNIAVYGHTDNIGSKTYNKQLSERRAKTIGLYLVDNGLSPFRIAWQGYGDEKPLLTNATEEGREKNRRVEFIISKKKREHYASGLFEDDDDN